MTRVRVPVPVCRFARAYRCRRLATEAAFGYDELDRQTFYGFRAHIRVCLPGVIVGIRLTPVDVHDLTAAEAPADTASSWLLGDRNYWSPRLTERLAHNKSAKREKQPWPRWLTHVRRRIETVFSQLVGRFNAKRIWAWDQWHLSSRWWRKIVSHTFAVFLGQQLNLPSPLQFADLITV